MGWQWLNTPSTVLNHPRLAGPVLTCRVSCFGLLYIMKFTLIMNVNILHIKNIAFFHCH